MKTLKLFIVLVAVCATTRIGAQSLAWAQEHGGTGFEAGYGVATDASGNVYTTGSFSSNL
ncbi:MAG: SBBP repeat-containing protein [Sphingobacteriaceae bacterium]|nr:SBBP repeat-containing protein [Sphingobacteriaceae bacterium]